MHPYQCPKPRASLRLPAYDYSAGGAYFITIVTHRRASLFGEIAAEMELSQAGQIAQEEWVGTANKRSSVELDAFVIMPNHMHAVVWLAHDDGTARCAATPRRFGAMTPQSLSSIVRAYKAATTRRIRLAAGDDTVRVWQRGFYERVVRNDAELTRIRQYIDDNPERWAFDKENPHGQPEAGATGFPA